MSDRQGSDVVQLADGDPAASGLACDPGGRVAWSGGLGRNPPCTDRGCFVPSDGGSEGGRRGDDIPPLSKAGQGVTFHVDYLKLTVFVKPCDLEVYCREFLEESLGLGSQDWESVCDEPKVAKQELNSGLWLFHDPARCQGKIWSIVELKGEACQAWGDTRLREFLMHLGTCGARWRACRVDPAWDGVPFSPIWFKRRVRVGDAVSRSLKVTDLRWMEDGATGGRTCYLGMRKDGKERMIRCYDKRGPVRLELETKGDWAEKCGDLMADNRPCDWSRLFLDVLVGAVDLRKGAAGENHVERLPRCAEWAAFVGGAETCALGKARPFKAPESEVRKLRSFAFRNALMLAKIKAAGCGEVLDGLVDEAISSRCGALGLENGEALLREIATDADRLKGQALPCCTDAPF